MAVKIGLVFGSTTGNTHDAADEIREQFAEYIDDCLDIDATDFETLATFDVLLVGIPTWDIGELEASWYFALERGENKDVRFDGLTVAFFGDGDQGGYPENFQDAMGILRELFIGRGASAEVGHWPLDGYEFDESKAVVDGKFVGLPLDCLNQPDETDERIQSWCTQLKTELGITELEMRSG
ncbi:MAG: flavodoxin [Myxococcota bacterium]